MVRRFDRVAVAVALDRAAVSADARGGAAAFELSVQQFRINQRISQAGVRRANRADERLDALTATSRDPGAPAGAPGAGAQPPTSGNVPGAVRVAVSAPKGGPASPVLDLPGFAMRVRCEADGGGTTRLIEADTTEPLTVMGTSTDDRGGDPADPASTESKNSSETVPGGPGQVVGVISAPFGEYRRSRTSVLFTTPTRTVSVFVAIMSDGVAGTCDFRGVAIPT